MEEKVGRDGGEGEGLRDAGRRWGTEGEMKKIQRGQTECRKNKGWRGKKE